MRERLVGLPRRSESIIKRRFKMNFEGMALYTEAEIRSALDNYCIGYDKACEALNSLIDAIESVEYKPSFLYRLFGVKDLVSRYTFWDEYVVQYRFIEWCKKKGYISVPKDYYDIVDPFTPWYTWFKLVKSDEYTQVKNLFNGGKDCYLNPNQAAFVNKYKEKHHNDL